MPNRFAYVPFLVCLVALPSTAEEETARRIVNDGNLVMEGIPEIPERLPAQLNRYQNVRSAFVQDWTEDGNGLYVLTRFGDVSQLHLVSMPGGARRQLTFFPEPIANVRRQPTGSSLGFRMDEGGSEFYQLFFLDPDSGESRRLTDGSSRNSAPVWSRDGKLLAYQSTRRDGRSNDVWLMEVGDPETARLILQAPDGSWWGPSDWSPDGTKLLVAQYVSITDSRIHLLELESGESTLLAGGDDKPGSYLGFSPQFDRSGNGIFLATDERSDFNQLAHLDLKTGALSIITADIPWDVEEFQMSDDGRRAAFFANQEGIDRLYLFDPATRKYRLVDDLPIGLGGNLRFSPDGTRLALTLNTSKTASDAFALELGGNPLEWTGFIRWTFSEVGGLDTEQFVEPDLAHFPTFDQVNGKPRMIPAFVYKPHGQGPHPVIVYIHGGPESQFHPRFSSTFQMWIDQLGAAVVAPNVRGSSGYGKNYVKLDNGFSREDSVKDIGALLDWIATQPDLDEGRVVVYGGSYGGYMVLSSLVHYSDRLRGGVDIVGISNFVSFLTNTQDYRRDLRRVEYGDERDPEMHAFLDRISPNRNAHKISAPLFVAQGQNDPRVPVTESEQIVRQVRSAGYDVWYLNALNEGHGFKKKANRDVYQQAVVLFFEKHLLDSE